MHRFFKEMVDEYWVAAAIFVICTLMMTFGGGVSVSETPAEIVVTVAWYRKLIYSSLSIVGIFGFIKYRRGNVEEYGLKFWLFILVVVFAQTAFAWRERFLVNENVMESRGILGTDTVPWNQATTVVEGLSSRGRRLYYCRTPNKTYEWSYELVQPAFERISDIAKKNENPRP